MSWRKNLYSSQVEQKEITTNVNETQLVPNYLGNNVIEATIGEIEINGPIVNIDKKLEKQIQVLGPSFKTFDNKYICTYDNKFINLKGGEENG